MSRSSASRTPRLTCRRSFGCVRGITLGLVALFTSGCVPVTVPVGDIEKAAPNEKLIGTWSQDEPYTWVVDRPDVKDNPKGLMRARYFTSANSLEKGQPSDTIWFFTTTVGKITYANALVSPEFGYAELSNAGMYAKWKKAPRYWIGLLVVEGDAVRMLIPDRKEFEQLMKDNEVSADKSGYYTLAPGALEKLLAKGLDGGLPADSGLKFTRVKGK